MKIKTLAAMAILAVMMIGLATTSAQAMEDKHHLGLFLNGSKELAPRIDLTYHINWTNYIGNQLPYTYVGLNRTFSDNFRIEGMVGYDFQAVEGDSGLAYALASNTKVGKFNFYNDLEYWSGTNCFFSYNSLTYPVGVARIGLDEANFYYFDWEDTARRAYRVGPSLRIPMSQNSTLGMFYFYQFENDGQDANVFKLTLSLNF